MVSVIVPAYNAELYITQAIDSALAQTYPHLEIVALDDGSTDNTWSILQAYSTRAVVLRQPNQGLATARNRAIEAARGDYVALLDADDLWAPTKIAQQVAFLEAHPACALVHTGRRVIDDAGGVIREMDLPPAHGRCLDVLARRNTITASSVVVRRSILGSEPFARDLAGCEDWDLWLRVAASHEVGYVEEPLIDYRLHATNMSRSSRLMLASAIDVLSRLISRTDDRAIVTEARAHRHRLQIALAHHEYDSGNFGPARQAFRQAGPPFGRADLARMVLCHLPAPLRRAVRSMRHVLEQPGRPSV